MSSKEKGEPQPPKENGLITLYENARPYRVFVMPVVFIIFCWLLVFTPLSPKITSYCADLTISFARFTGKKYTEAVHAGNVSLVDTFALGVLNEKYLSEGSDRLNILAQATKLVGLKTREITAEEFEDLMGSFDLAVYNKALLNRILGFCDLVNCMWFFSIIGIIYNTIPALYFATKPIHKYFEGFFIMLAKRVRIIIATYIAPIIPALDREGFFEVIIYYIVFCILVMSFRSDPREKMSVAYAILSYSLLLSAICYTSALYDSKRSYEDKVGYRLNALFLASVPMVHQLNSDVLGFACVFVMYLAIFMNKPYRKCLERIYQIDLFQHPEQHASIVGFHLFALDLFTRHYGNNLLGLNLDSFKFGLVFFGVMALCFFRVFDRDLQRNPVPALALGGVLLGMWKYFAMPGMLNIAIMYGIAYVVAHMMLSQILWVIKVFQMSLVGYKVALYLHANPEFLADMFTK